MRGGIWVGLSPGALGMALTGVLTVGLIGLPVEARANVTPDPAACLARLPAASQVLFQGCSCSGTTLLIDFPGVGEARTNDPLCTPATSTSTTDMDSQGDADGQTGTGQQSGSEGAQGEATYTVTQQTQGSGADDWLDGVDPISVPYWISSQTGRYNNRSPENRAFLEELARLDRQLAEAESRLQRLDDEFEQLKAREDQLRRERDVAILTGDLDRADRLTDELTSIDKDKIPENKRLRGDAMTDVQRWRFARDKFINDNRGTPFRSTARNSDTASVGAPDWAFSHGADESPWRHFSGRVSLNDLRRHMAHRRYLLAQTADGRPVADQFLIPDLAVDQRFNAWVAGSYTWTDDDRAGAAGDSTNGQVTLGASYLVSETVNAGLQLRYRRIVSNRNDGSAFSEADGFGGSVFAQILLPFGAAVTPIIAYERTDTHLTQMIGGTGLTGSFDTDIWTFGTQVGQRFDIHDNGTGGIYWVEPQASLSYVTAQRDGYVRSDGVVVPADTVNDGSLTFGGEIGAEFLAPAERIAVLAPSLGVTGVWNFDRPGDQLLTTGTTIATPDVFAALTAALDVVFGSGPALSGSLTYSGLGSDVRSWTVGGRLTIPFGG